MEKIVIVLDYWDTILGIFNPPMDSHFILELGPCCKNVYFDTTEINSVYKWLILHNLDDSYCRIVNTTTGFVMSHNDVHSAIRSLGY